MNVRPGQTFTAVLTDAPSGMVGTLGIQIEDGDANTIVPRTTSGIVEIAPSSGVYVKNDLVAPHANGSYLIVWDDTVDFAEEDLFVGNSPVIVVQPLVQSDRIELIQGDDYLVADGRAITWIDAGDAWPSLTGGSLHLEVSKEPSPFAMSVVDADTVRLELTDTQTGGMKKGLHRFAVVATLSNTHVVTLVAGNLIVHEQDD